MKQIYILILSVDGRPFEYSTFSTLELAKEAEAAVIEQNKNLEPKATTRIEETILFESKEQIPILNNGGKY